MRSQRCSITVFVSLLLATNLFLATGQEVGQGQSVMAVLKPALETIRGDEILSHVKKLASDEFEGRGPGTRGELLTVEYLSSELKRTGLSPGNPDGTYFQKVPMVGYLTIPRINISAGGKSIPLNFLDDFVHDFPSLRPSVSAMNCGVVFAGYGIVAPEYGWDDYKNTDVRNKLVIVLGGEPSAPYKGDPKKLDPSVFKGETRTYYSTRDFKFDLAAKKGAAGILVISDPEKARTYSLFRTFAGMEGVALRQSKPKSTTIISGLITLAAARRIFNASQKDLGELEKAADRKDFNVVETKTTADIAISSRLRDFTSKNVVARIEGSDPRLKNEYLVYSAHWDHLGIDPNLKGDQIYNGAVDDAIGIAQLLSIARGFARLTEKPRRSILFVATTSEEKGFLGSRYYANNALYPIGKTVANINLDGGNAWGRTRDVTSSGYGLSTLDEVLGDAAALQGRVFIKESIDNYGLYFSSDQIEFAKVGVPAVFPFSGVDYSGKPKDFGDKKWTEYSDKHYHRVSDDVQADWDLAGAAEDAQWLLIAGYDIAQAIARPNWKAGSEFLHRR